MPEKKTYSATNLFFRSLIFSIFSLTSIIFYGSFFVLFTWPLSVKQRFFLIHYYVRFYFWALKCICHIDYKVIGLKNLPKNRTGIVMSKHQSTLETFLLPYLLKNPAIIVKRELLWLPFFGWGLALTDPIAIDRSNRSQAMNQLITKGTKCLNQHRWILVFPEGTRVAYGKIGNYKLGGARLAVATEHPILPIAHDAGRFWPRRKFIKHPGTVKIVIGPMIESKGKTPEEILAATKEWIEHTMQKIDEM